MTRRAPRPSSAPRAAALGALVVALALAGAAGADPPKPADAPKKKVITLIDGCFGPQRSALAGARFGRALERSRAALTACHALALAEAPDTAAEVAAELGVAPNGEVAAVTLGVRGHVPDDALACFRRALVGAYFDPPEGGRATVAVSLLLGDAPAAKRPAPLPFRTELGRSWRAVAPPMRLSATPAPKEARAVREAVRAAEACAAASKPASAVNVDAKLLVGSAGELARVEAASEKPAGEAVARCLAGAVVAPPQGVVTRVDVRLVIRADGKASVATGGTP